MKNVIIKVVAVAAIMLSFAFSWVSSPAYALNKFDLAPFTERSSLISQFISIATVAKTVATAGETTLVVEPQFESNIALKAAQDEVTVPISTLPVENFSINLDEYKNGTGFTGVYNLLTKQWKVKPSVEHEKIFLKNGDDVSVDAVKRKGGHSNVENELIIAAFIPTGKDSQYEIFRNHNVGFFFKKIDDKNLEIVWRSGRINERNFNNICAPDESRELIKSAIRTGTKYEIVERKKC